MPPRVLALAVAVGAACAGCILELDGSIACGDGFVDRAAGEECDPADMTSYEDACAGTIRPLGVAACDEITCTIINDRDQCSICGDGILDQENGETCDGDQFLADEVCESVNGQLLCSSDCVVDRRLCPCGDGVIDESLGEDCEPGQTEDIASIRPCAGSEMGLEALKSPYPQYPYTHGVAGTCNHCYLDRLGCSYCNNGRLDAETQIDNDGNKTMAEWCDGHIFDDDRLEQQYPGVCDDLPGTRPSVRCAENCLGFDEPQSGLECCLGRGEPCPQPGPGSGPRCCIELTNPDPGTPICQLVGSPEFFRNVCN